MREIKFRGWDEEDKEMLLIYGAWFEEQGNYLEMDLTKIAHGERFILMQFTGLRDNTKWEQLTKEEQTEWIESGNNETNWNGKEIYEGDIVRWYPMEKQIGEVVFDEGTYRIKQPDDFAWTLFNSLNYNLEVIGNIYENPGLLEQG